jgi:cation diffusion facilitator CzcD-associated flavoprotein CzcO
MVSAKMQWGSAHEALENCASKGCTVQLLMHHRYWNRYPGAMCDIESYIYMPLLEEIDYMPSEKYAKAKELLAHSRMIGEKFDLYSRALFQTETKEMRWNEDEGKWVTHTARGDKIKSRFIIPAAGPLHRPKLLGVPGIEDFKGHAFHSSRWDFD